MADDEKETFTKIVIDLPDAEDGVGGEGVWTVALGDDLYEVRNSPWHTLEVNFLDVVRAVAPSEDRHPVFAEVYRRGGHRSIHIVFLSKEDGVKREVLEGVGKLGANYENANGVLYAIDLPPNVSFDAVVDFLEDWQERGILEQRYAAQPQPLGTRDRVQ